MPDLTLIWRNTLLAGSAAVLALSGLGGRPTLAQDQASQDCQHPVSQAQISSCAGQRAREADQSLNRSYQILKASLPSGQVELLLASQLAWIRFRDHQCAFEKSFEAGGSLSITSQLECLARLSKARDQELRSLQPLHPQATITPRSASTLIQSDAIGPARLGMSLAELRANLPPHTTLLSRQSLFADVDALPVANDGVTLFYVLIPQGGSINDNHIIRALLTTNPAFRTQEGVGPGMQLADAARLYGPATVSMNRSNESRETARFARHPAKTIGFGIKANNSTLAGIYPTPLKEFNQSERYQQTTKITYVLVGGF